jgi:RNA recognition motif-containing protein
MFFVPLVPQVERIVDLGHFIFSPFSLMSTPGTKRLFVGNVPFRIEAADLRAEFEQVAPVADFFWPTDRETGRKKGFLFVDVAEEDMAAMIEAMNGKDIMGRQLAVNEAQPREERAPRPPRSEY